MRTSGATLTALGGAGMVATTASADPDPSAGILADGFEDAFDGRAFARGFASRYGGRYGSPDPLERLATNARNEFDANSDQWVAYGNWLLEEQNVRALGGGEIGVTFKITRGRWPFSNPDPVETAIHVGYDDAQDAFDSLEWVDEPAEDPIYEFTVSNRAAEYAHAELIDYRETWIGDDADDHEVPDAEYVNELAGKYWDAISMGEDERSVIELLLGEVEV